MSKSFSNRRWTSKNGGSKLATLMDDKATELCLQAFGIAPRPRVAKLLKSGGQKAQRFGIAPRPRVAKLDTVNRR